MNLFEYRARKDVSNQTTRPNIPAYPVLPSSITGLNPPNSAPTVAAPAPNPAPQPIANGKNMGKETAKQDHNNVPEFTNAEEAPKERHFNLRREIRIGIEQNNEKELKRYIQRAPSAMVVQEFRQAFKAAMKRDTAEGLRKLIKLYKSITESTEENGETRPPIAPYLPNELEDLPQRGQEKLDKMEGEHKQLLEKWLQHNNRGEVRQEHVLDVYRRHKIQIALLSILPAVVGIINTIAFVFVNLLVPGLSFINYIIYIIVALWLIYSYIDWSNDYLMITDKRVMQIEKTLFFNEEKKEIPVEKVEQVEYDANRNFLEFTFKIGTVTINGAGKTELVFNRVYLPDRIRREITEARFTYMRDRNQLRSKRMDNNLRNKLLGEKLVDWYEAEPYLEAVPRTEQSWWQAVLPSKPVAESSVSITLHEHVVFFYRKFFKIFFFYLAAALYGLFGMTFLFSLGIAALSIVAFSALIIGLIVTTIILWYDWSAWFNHRYILSRRDIIEVEKKPFGLDEEKSVILLSKVQDVESFKPSIFSQIFDYGDVRVTTAGAGKPIVFDRVPQPNMVQAEISRLMNVAKNLAEDNNDRVVLDYFTEYHRILQDMIKNSGQTTQPNQPNQAPQ